MKATITINTASQKATNNPYNPVVPVADQLQITTAIEVSSLDDVIALAQQIRNLIANQGGK